MCIMCDAHIPSSFVNYDVVHVFFGVLFWVRSKHGIHRLPKNKITRRTPHYILILGRSTCTFVADPLKSVDDPRAHARKPHILLRNPTEHILLETTCKCTRSNTLTRTIMSHPAHAVVFISHRNVPLRECVLRVYVSATDARPIRPPAPCLMQLLFTAT